MKKSWDKLQDQGRETTAGAALAYEEFSGRPQTTRGVASGTVPSEVPSAAPKAAARPKRAARAADAIPAVAPDAPEDTGEKVTATITVRRPPPRAKRAAAKSTSGPADAVVETLGEHGEEDYDDWSWDVPSDLQATTRSRAAATRRAPRAHQPDADDDL